MGGLVFGWLSSVNRRLGRIPEPTLWLFDSVGLAAFLAVTGLSAGPDFVRGLREYGVGLVIVRGRQRLPRALGHRDGGDNVTLSG